MPPHFLPSAPLLALSSSSSARPPGHRSGEGAESVLPGVREDADRRPDPQGGAPAGHGATEGKDPKESPRPRNVGKYLVSPLVRMLENGWFASSVSIRSGSGCGTTDRVLRLTRLFRSAAQAVDYARAEALQWITAAHLLAAA